MKVLPPITTPPQAVVVRRHTPQPGPYRTYRACLRWEFGHGCAFCLTHEADLVEHGVEGTGLTSIEHQVPQSDTQGGPQVDQYTNCFYACRYCNQARGHAPLVGASGARLLDPCRHAWASHFTRIDARLLPTANDPDASRTHRIYDLDDQRKQSMRRNREALLAEALRTLDTAPALIEQLLLAAETPGEKRVALIAAAQSLRGLMTRARDDLMRFVAVPPDADPVCRCATPEGRSLPAFLKEQLLEIPP